MAMADFDTGMEDDFVDYVRERSNTWPRSQLKLADQSVVFSPQFSPLTSQCSSQLSLITESNESINTSHAADGNRWGIDTLNCRKQSSPAVISNYKAGHPSYVELITQAILSSPEKRMTLSEIYDWMVANVSAFKDQRHLHSSTGWKNSVRHNLSLHSRFKRVKRNGMDKPSWWMVDMSEEVKRDRRHRNLKAGARIRTSPRDDGTFNIPNVNQNYGNVNSVNSFNGMNNQTNEISPLSNMADPFVPQMVTLNSNQTAANVGVNHFAIYDVSDDNSTNFMTPLPIKQQQVLPNYAESCAKAGWYQDRSDWYCYDYVNTDYSASTEKHNKLSNDTFAKIVTNNIGQIQYQQQQKIIRKEHTAVARLSSSSLSSCSFSSPSGDSVLHSSLETIDNVSVPTNLHGFAQAITVNLRDPTIVGNGQCLIERPTITLNVNADLCPSNSSIHINHNNRGQSGRANSAEEARQFLRVQTANGTVQDVTIPAPVQLKIVIRGEKSCQTDDLETDLQYRLHLNSPTELHYNNNGSVINYNGTSPETAASANVCANDIMSNEQQQKSINISPYHVFSENGLNGCVPDPLPWFQDSMKDGSQLGDLCESYNGFKFVH